MARVDEHKKFKTYNSDFVRRKRHGRLRNTVLGFGIGITLAIVLVLNAELIGGRTLFIILFVACLLGPLLHTLYVMQRNLDLVMGIEFQNALFSSAMFESDSFSLILNQDGSVVFNDNEIQNFIPNIYLNNFVDDLAKLAELSQDDLQRLYYALLNGKKEHFVFPIKQLSGETRMLRVTFRPLRRPHGYFLIQGRFFVPARVEHELPVLVRKGKVRASASQQVLHLLNYSPSGLYVANGAGQIQFINACLESALGYDEGQVIKDGLRIVDLRYAADQVFARDDEWQVLDDQMPMRGKVMLRRKNGSLLKAMIRQDISRDEQGGILMMMAVVDVLDV